MYLVQTISPGTKHIKHKSIIGIIENIVTGVSKKKKNRWWKKREKKKTWLPAFLPLPHRYPERPLTSGRQVFGKRLGEIVCI